MVTTEIRFNHCGAIAAALEPALVKALEESAQRITDEAKALCPVKTGALQGGITHEPTGDLEETVHTSKDTDYDVFVELGTSRQAAQPFMTPAAEHERPRFETEVAAILNRIP